MTHHFTINGRFLTQPLTGVQRYAREIVTALDAAIARTPDISATLLVPSSAVATLPLRAISVRQIGRLSGQAWEQLELPVHARGTLLSLCNTGPIAYPNQIVTIHDTNTRDAPESYARPFRLLYRALHPTLGRTARTIATVSNFSATQLVRYGIAPARKILIAPNGSEHASALRAAPPVPPPHPRNTIVTLGSAAPHKNLRLLLGLAPRLHDVGLRLCIIGKSDPRIFSSLAMSASHPAIEFAGTLSDADMARRLQSALCLAFPSFTEGFGLPPLEAMALGCPVVVSDRASLPEVCGSAALYASPETPAAWLAAFQRLRDDTSEWNKRATLGLAQAANYTWTASAQTYLAAIKNAAPRSAIAGIAASSANS